MLSSTSVIEGTFDSCKGVAMFAEGTTVVTVVKVGS